VRQLSYRGARRRAGVARRRRQLRL
jgi:hypothetical protein